MSYKTAVIDPDVPKWGQVRCDDCGAVVYGYFPLYNKNTGRIERLCVECIDRKKPQE